MLRTALAVLVLVVASAMGARPAVAQPSTVVLPSAGSFLYLNSEPGDVIGDGVERLFTATDASFDASLPPGSGFFNGFVMQGWFTHSSRLFLSAPAGQALAVGSYTGTVDPMPGSDRPGLAVSVDSRACMTPTGQFDVSGTAFSPYGDLLVFDMTFEQHCNGPTAALFGRIRI